MCFCLFFVPSRSSHIPLVVARSFSFVALSLANALKYGQIYELEYRRKCLEAVKSSYEYVYARGLSIKKYSSLSSFSSLSLEGWEFEHPIRYRSLLPPKVRGEMGESLEMEFIRKLHSIYITKV